jgi:hypothetical protein
LDIAFIIKIKNTKRNKKIEKKNKNQLQRSLKQGIWLFKDGDGLGVGER